MPSAAQAVSIVVAVALAYLWLQVPLLREYSLQIFALMMVVFFVIKRLRKAELWHIAPEPGSFELTIITFSFLLLIGSTGNTSSIFFPLGFIHLFFIVLATTVPVAIVATASVMLFHYAADPRLGIELVQTLITLPIMLALFMFAKFQYDQSKYQEKVLEKEKSVIDTLSREEQVLESFVTSFLRPKLQELHKLVQDLPQADQLKQELQTIEDMSAEIVEKSKQQQTPK